MSQKENGLRVQIPITILNLVSNRTGDVYDHLMNARILTSILTKTIIVAHKMQKDVPWTLTLSFVMSVCTTFRNDLASLSLTTNNHMLQKE